MSEVARECGEYQSIDAYALVGDCHTAALVSRDGSIDWYCPGRFDAPAVFCRLLDAHKGGYLGIAPVGGYSTTRRYRGATNVLETTFTTGEASVRLTDLMPSPRRPTTARGGDVEPSRRILRLVEAPGSGVDLVLRFKPTFDFARAQTELLPAMGGAIAHSRGRYLALVCPGVVLEPDDGGGLRALLHLRAGERRWVELADVDDLDHARRALTATECDELLAGACDYWERWSAACTYRGPYRTQVLRSALALKLLTYAPTGAIVAAPTTSLPERIGGVRNWDYRYAWLRDASLTLYSLMTVGYQAEASDFFRWLERTQQAGSAAAPQIAYAVDGGRVPNEVVLDGLEGYRCSRPVRVGNAAARQRQLDVYGEVLSAAHLHFRASGATRSGRGKRPSPETWALLRALVNQAARRWPEPDNGIWEVRSQPQQFLHSRLMCWVALDRGIRLAREYGLPAPIDAWEQTRRAVRRAILERGFDDRTRTFTQAFGSLALDASVLAIPRVGFLAPTDPRVRSTVERIRAELGQSGLVYRYRTPDGLPGAEAAFALCSFWLVDALALGGQLDEAHDLFERVTGYANDVGLLSEEIDPVTGALLGNFPQGFTHLALIRSAVNLAKAAKHGAEERPETEARRASRARHAAAEGHSTPRRGRRAA